MQWQSVQVRPPTDAGEFDLPDENFHALFSECIGNPYITDMLLENFFRNTTNPKIQEQMKKYINDNNIDTEYSRTLLKKYNSLEQKEIKDNKETIRYVYDGKEYDENINLFDFYEIYPFDDEFGMLLFDNDWNIMTFNSDVNTENNLWLMCGGGTNSLTVHLKKTENVLTSEDLTKAMNRKER